MSKLLNADRLLDLQQRPNWERSMQYSHEHEDESVSGDTTRESLADASRYERIYALVRQIPVGYVATYGQIAAMEGHCAPRNIGYALAALRDDDVPWQRVINRQGTISERAGGGGTYRQRRLLETEGVYFDQRGRIDFKQVGWSGPEWTWLKLHGFFAAPLPWL